ncbi:MAG: FecR domain-containing protein [Verrucomicrobia bacterium]|nr:FecR domain-containing protein [Verrucomicrobiota bacterium]
MNTSNSRHDSAAEEQASLWAARLEGGTLEAADRAALDAWLAAKPAHRALLSDYCQFSADLEQTLPAMVASGAVKMPALAQPSRRRWNVSWLTVAGGTLAAAAAVALGLWIAQPSTQFQPKTYVSSVAERQSFTLDDGTRVELNAQTSLLVEHTRDERRVRLASGEAFFSVAKDPSRPFIVETPTGSVRVTGTVFDVRTDKSSELEVTVVEGSVQVRPADLAGTGPIPPSALTAGHHLTAYSGVVTKVMLPPGGVDDALAWRQGKIVANHFTLRAALARFAQYNGRGITVSPGAENLSVGGVYSLSDLSGFLDIMGQVHPKLRVYNDPSGIIRVSLRTEP